MRLFGLKLDIKRQARWASYEEFLNLSTDVHKLSLAVDAMRKKVYRDKGGDDGAGEIEPDRTAQLDISLLRTGARLPD